MPRTLQTAGADQVLSFPGIDVESTIALGFWSASAFAPLRRPAHVRPLGCGWISRLRGSRAPTSPAGT